MESSKLDDHITSLVGTGDFQVEKVSYSDETVWIDKAKTHGFLGVPEECEPLAVTCPSLSYQFRS